MKPPGTRLSGGDLRGRPLLSTTGALLRPTTAANRQMVFNMLAARVSGSRFLDLFAGTGAMGFEALSRGAEYVLFVEKEAVSADSIRRNGEHLKLTGRYAVQTSDAGCLDPVTDPPFDLIFADPPYELFPAPGLARWSQWLSVGGMAVYEHSSKHASPTVPGLTCVKNRRGGEALFSFYQFQEGGPL